MQQYRQIFDAILRVYQNSGFVMAGAMAFSFVLSLFPFCIFLGAVASVFGGRPLATQAVTQLFAVMPKSVAEVLAPQIEQIMDQSRVGLLTVSGLLALFFATSANETLRSAINNAYRVTETRSYFLCLALSALFLLVSALAMLIVAWVLVVGPNLVTHMQIPLLAGLLQSDWSSTLLRHGLAGLTLAVYLLGVHLWLAAGERTIWDVWPGVLLTIVLMLALAGLYSSYIALGNYALFYAGLSQIMIALIFFQLTGVAILMGAELNRGIAELSRMSLQELTSP